MNQRTATIIIVGLFIPLSIALVIYGVRLNPTLNKVFTPKIVYENQQLAQQMKSFKASGTNLTLAEGISGGDPIFGGNVINGVLTDLTTTPIPIRTKDGKEIAKSIMTFTIKYLNDKGSVETINLSAAFQLPDGTYHGLDWTPYRLPDPTVNIQRYEDKVGTAVFGLFGIQSEQAIQKIKDMGKTSEEIAEAETVYHSLDAYQNSWKQEIDQMILGGDKGKMDFLFPITYLNGSFDSTYANFKSVSKQ